MDDSACREFFEQPSQTYHRRYEALRAVFLDQRSQKEVAQAFGFTYDSMRQLVHEFRQVCDTENEPVESPFFDRSTSDAPWRMTTKPVSRLVLIDEHLPSRPAHHYG